MALRTRWYLAWLTVALSATACAPVAQWSPGQVDSVADKIASAAIEQWGLSKGVPREAKLRDESKRLLSDPAFAAAMNKRPQWVASEDWINRLELEGYPLLTDDELRRFLGASSRLLNEATDAECAAFMRLKSGDFGPRAGADGAIWRQRLARISEDDFDIYTRTQTDALLARARRIDELPVTLSEAEYMSGLDALAPYFPEVTRKKIEPFLDKDPTKLTPMEACTLKRAMLSAQSQVRGATAGLSLRLLLVQVRN